MPRERFEPRLERVVGYEAPERRSRAFRYRPFTGRVVKQRLIDPVTNSPYRLKVRLLRSQCQARTARGARSRCRRTTDVDYTMCNAHLMSRRNLLVAASRIEGANLGLFAVAPERFRRLGLDDRGAPVRDDNKVVFRRGDRIGGRGCAFRGELITDDEMNERYPYPNGGDYVVQGPESDDSERFYFDEFAARTVLSYSNDGVNLKHPLLARNSKKGRYDETWPHRINASAYADDEDPNAATYLQACEDIRHGDEILWSYAETKRPSKNGSGDWRRDRHGMPIDSYWSASNRFGDP